MVVGLRVIRVRLIQLFLGNTDQSLCRKCLGSHKPYQKVTGVEVVVVGCQINRSGF